MTTTNVGMWFAALLMVPGPFGPRLDAGVPLTMTVTPAHSFAPANLEVRVRIEPNAGNRTLAICADSVDFYRSSGIQLDGERAPRIISLRFRSLPGGTYVVRGALFDESGHERASAWKEVVVITSGP